MNDPLTPLRAFLFTDIVGSTRLWTEHREGMAQAQRAHDAILRDAVSSVGGVIYKVVGDGIQAAFGDPSAALRAACRAQRQIDEVAVPGMAAPEPLQLRMALHVAAASPDETGDYRSPELNLPGRLLDIAAGGQLLATSAFAAALGGDLPGDIELQELGAFRIRGLPIAERIWQALDPSRNAPFVHTRPAIGNLPNPPSSIVGRELDISQHRLLIRAGETRLLTLTGPGGVGKTRLAVEIAAGLGSIFPDGIWFIDLAALRRPDAILPTIAVTVGAREADSADPLRRLAATLDGSSLLILDNVEHLLPEASTLIADLLSSVPSMTVIATSRSPLDIRLERVRSVTTLPSPPITPDLAVEDLLRSPATRLLIERAQEKAPDIAPDDRAAPGIAGICERLDGLPLAIELVAARIALDRPQEGLASLEQRLPALGEGPRDQPERQRTLAATIGWSYGLLTDTEQAAFRALSVAPATLALDAAAAVIDGDDTAIDRLARQHLVALEPGPAGEPRVRMLQTVREFARGAAGDAGELDLALDRLAAWTAERFAPYYGVTPTEPTEQLVAEEPNLEAALERLLATGQAGAAARLGIAAYWFWRIAGGRIRRATAWLVRLADAAAVDGSDPAVTADAYLYLAQCQYPLGFGSAVDASLQACAEWMQRAGNPAEFFEHRRFLAVDALYRGRATESLDRISALDRDLWPSLNADQRQLLLLTMVQLTSCAGAFDVFDEYLARYTNLMSAADSEWISDELLQFRAEKAWLTGQTEEAIVHFTAASERYAAHGDTFGYIYALIDRIFLCADWDRSLLDGWLAEANNGAHEIDDLIFSGDLDIARAVIAWRHGDPATAAALTRKSLDIAIRLPMIFSQLRALRWLAVFAFDADDPHVGAWLLGGADELTSRACLAARLVSSPVIEARRERILENPDLSRRYEAGRAAPLPEIEAAALAWRPSTQVTGRG